MERQIARKGDRLRFRVYRLTEEKKDVLLRLQKGCAAGLRCGAGSARGLLFCGQGRQRACQPVILLVELCQGHFHLAVLVEEAALLDGKLLFESADAFVNVGDQRVQMADLVATRPDGDGGADGDLELSTRLPK